MYNPFGTINRGLADITSAGVRAGSKLIRQTGNLVDDISGKTAAKGAAKAQKEGIDKAQSSMDKYFQASLDTQKPWLEAGGRGLSQLESGINSGEFETPVGQFQDLQFDFEADPGYQFRMQQGNKAVQASAAARGGLFSGKTGMDLQDYSQGLASQEYGNAYGRFQDQRNFNYGKFGDTFNRERAVKTDKYNRLASLAGVGQMTASNVAQQQMEQGGNLGNLAMARGNIGAQRSQAGYQGAMNLFNTGLQGGVLAAKAFMGGG